MRMGAVAGIVLAALPAPLRAADWSPSLSVSIASDERRRGLSWSDGRPAAQARGVLSLPAGFDLSLAATSLRGSARHGDADAVIDSALVYRHSFGPISADAQIVHHAFAGGNGRLNYVELGAGASTLLGPVELAIYGLYAPSQQAIGGDNLYVAASASAAIVGTPFSLRGHIGRSSGGSDDAIRSARLRPRGTYNDFGLGVDHVTGPLRIGLSYTDTFGGHTPANPALARDGDARLTARMSVDF
jgi:uncharacterized protein (TIGR02001 family)